MREVFSIRHFKTQSRFSGQNSTEGGHTIIRVLVLPKALSSTVKKSTGHTTLRATVLYPWECLKLPMKALSNKCSGSSKCFTGTEEGSLSH